MNPLEKFRAYYAQHRAMVLAGGAAAVVGVALYRRHRGTIGAAATSAAPGVTAVTSGPAGTTAPSSVDTSSYDLYDSVQSQLQGFANQLATMQATGGATGIGATVPTQPTSAATPTAAPKAPAPAPMLSIAAPAQNADASFTSPAQIAARLNEVLSNRNIPTTSLPPSLVASYTQQIANGQATIDQFRTAANSYASAQGQTAFRVP